MKQENYTLFENGNIEEITSQLAKELETRNESPFWADKIVPFSYAVLSVLIPLRENDLLFTPEGKAANALTPELFLQWNDFLSLKTLAFTLAKSNEAKELLRTSLEKEQCKRYEPINLEFLGEYLSKYTVDLEREDVDFPIANYNLHQGVSNVIKSLL